MDLTLDIMCVHNCLVSNSSNERDIMTNALDIAIAEAQAVLSAIIANPNASHAEETLASTFKWYRDLSDQRDITRLRAKLMGEDD